MAFGDVFNWMAMRSAKWILKILLYIHETCTYRMMMVVARKKLNLKKNIEQYSMTKKPSSSRLRARQDLLACTTKDDGSSLDIIILTQPFSSTHNHNCRKVVNGMVKRKRTKKINLVNHSFLLLFCLHWCCMHKLWAKCDDELHKSVCDDLHVISNDV